MKRRQLLAALSIGWGVALASSQLLAGSSDFRFAKGESTDCIPFDASNRLVALEARVNGRETLRFALDTGASRAVLEEKRAAALGLETRGVQHAHGAGGAQVGSSVRGVDLALPGLKILDQSMTTLALEAISARSGRPLDGVLGRPVLRNLALEIDYPRRCVSFHDGESYRYQGTGTVLPIEILEGLPYVSARVVFPGGRSLEGRFVIDTGASTALALSPEPVEREGVWETIGKTLEVPARGVGGGFAVRLARIERLELAGFTFQNPIAAFQPTGAGRISARQTVGNIGGGVLNRFKVIVDYPRKRMILEPGPALAEPFESDMSGLSLVSDPPDYRRITVERVLDASPALDAGVKEGDVIEAVDGVSVAEIGMPELRERLRREGREFRLDLRRGEERVGVTLRTRRMI